MKKLILGIYMILFCSVSAYMNIYPTNFDKRIDGIGDTEEYIITNTTNKILKYRIYLEESNENDMSKWIQIYPESLILKPGQEKKVKIYINSPEGIKEGEYSAVLGVKEVHIPKITKNEELLDVYTNLKLKIYGYVGELPIKIETKNIVVKKINREIKMSGEIKNLSKRRIDIDFIYDDGKNDFIIAEERIRKDEILDLNQVELFLNNIDIQSGKIKIVDKKKKEVLKEIKI
jgi:hypothetical protein